MFLPKMIESIKAFNCKSDMYGKLKKHFKRKLQLPIYFTYVSSGYLVQCLSEINYELEFVLIFS